MTPMQSKLARTALDLGVRDMKDFSSVSSSTVGRFERGDNIGLDSYKALQAAYEAHGIQFISREGVHGILVPDGPVIPISPPDVATPDD